MAVDALISLYWKLASYMNWACHSLKPKACQGVPIKFPFKRKPWLSISISNIHQVKLNSSGRKEVGRCISLKRQKNCVWLYSHWYGFRSLISFATNNNRKFEENNTKLDVSSDL